MNSFICISLWSTASLISTSCYCPKYSELRNEILKLMIHIFSRDFFSVTLSQSLVGGRRLLSSSRKCAITTKASFRKAGTCFCLLSELSIIPIGTALKESRVVVDRHLIGIMENSEKRQKQNLLPKNLFSFLCSDKSEIWEKPWLLGVGVVILAFSCSPLSSGTKT